MRSYKKKHLKELYNIKTVEYNYDKPIEIFKYIKYLKKALNKLSNRKGTKQYSEVIYQIYQVQADISYFEDENLDLIETPLQEIRARLIIYQQKLGL